MEPASSLDSGVAAAAEAAQVAGSGVGGGPVGGIGAVRCGLVDYCSRDCSPLHWKKGRVVKVQLEVLPEAPAAEARHPPAAR
jgi:hypothetical protein